MLDHQRGEAVPVNKNDFLWHALRIFDGRFFKTAGGNENAFVGLLSGKGSDKTLNVFSPNCGFSLIAFCLNVDYI